MSRPGGEVPLFGGIANAGLVVRVGNTVRRPMRPTAAATQALLEHLERVGFEGAPRFLGVDEKGREVLSYVAGEAVTPPTPDWALTDRALASVAELLRGYHDAVASFDPSPYDWPTAPPADFGPRLVSHNDPNLDNVVFRDGRAVALIDFDLASPGSRVWDVAGAARLWSPLRAAVDIADLRSDQVLRRFRLFVDAYGLEDSSRRRVPEAVRLHHDWVYEIVRIGGEQGIAGYAEYWRRGGAERAVRSRTWLAAHSELLAEALLEPLQR